MDQREQPPPGLPTGPPLQPGVNSQPFLHKERDRPVLQVLELLEEPIDHQRVDCLLALLILLTRLLM